MTANYVIPKCLLALCLADGYSDHKVVSFGKCYPTGNSFQVKPPLVGVTLIGIDITIIGIWHTNVSEGLTAYCRGDFYQVSLNLQCTWFSVCCGF